MINHEAANTWIEDNLSRPYKKENACGEED